MWIKDKFSRIYNETKYSNTTRTKLLWCCRPINRGWPINTFVALLKRAAPAITITITIYIYIDRWYMVVVNYSFVDTVRAWLLSYRRFPHLTRDLLSCSVGRERERERCTITIYTEIQMIVIIIKPFTVAVATFRSKKDGDYLPIQAYSILSTVSSHLSDGSVVR